MSSLQATVDLLITLLGIAFYGHILGTFKAVKFEMAELSFLNQRISHSLTAAIEQLTVP